MLEGTHVRGRIARLDDVAHTIIARHDYPPIIAALLAETMVLASMLATTLGTDGILTLQMKGTGHVRLMVVDVAYGGGLRAYAELAEDSAPALAALDRATLPELFGEQAYLAITMEPGEGMARYQGVVALEGATIAEAMTAYFTHSQQVDVAFTLAVTHSHDTRVASGIMLERMPEEGGIVAGSAVHNEDAWRYAEVMLRTLKSDELGDRSLALTEILNRLYHEQGVVVFDAVNIHAGCRCSRGRILNLLMSMDVAERMEMLVDHQASVHCQFCNKTEFFSAAELEITAQ